ncbi:CatB-related O-acetyltransferase [Spiroplasma cantharicola]|uniref:Virginiamycin A acetyltransferase n=1 Tax=Spiroplasma cantharicola TaxID=362837 RepID=A0A0M4JVV0_9MOLU|nr:CatB-related O-acetyltransferase [Spiroplasma cantharicola]ALD65955.1 virginiamycin A acetyltransferase [Spiroplasma cantharicola]
MSKSSKIYLLKDYITNTAIEVGEYSYFYSFQNEKGAREFQNRNILYHFPNVHKDKLIIGNFCAIAEDVKFLMNGANHRIDSISTYPFEMFKEFEFNEKTAKPFKSKGDTVIGHDVWIGYGATIMPGVKIGNGSIIAAKAVVTKDVEPYSIVAGNPAKVKRMRFEKNKIKELEDLQWWNESIESIKTMLEKLTK